MQSTTLQSSVPIKLIFSSKSAILLDTCWFNFNFAIVKHAKIADFWVHADTLKSSGNTVTELLQLFYRLTIS